jgi:hypothetical protein
MKMHNKKMNPWTEEEIAVLIEMIQHDHPARWAARRLNRSRDAVLGKIFRLDLRERVKLMEKEPEPEPTPDEPLEVTAFVLSGTKCIQCRKNPRLPYYGHKLCMQCNRERLNAELYEENRYGDLVRKRGSSLGHTKVGSSLRG